MMSKKDVLDWIQTLNDDSSIAIDEGGLSLVEVNAEGEETEAYLEIGMTPREEYTLNPEDDEEEE